MHTLMIVDDSNIIRRRIERCNKKGKFRLDASEAKVIQDD